MSEYMNYGHIHGGRPFKAGDAITLGTSSTSIHDGSIASGYISSTNTQIFMAIPVGRKIEATNVSFSGTVIFRGVNGYTGDSSTQQTISLTPSGCTSNYSYTTEINNAEMGYIKMCITRTSAFGNSTNNTPVVAVLKGTFTFS